MRCIDEVVIYRTVFWVATMCNTEYLVMQKGGNTTLGWSDLCGHTILLFVLDPGECCLPTNGEQSHIH